MYVFMCLHVYIQGHVCACSCEGQRSMSGVFLSCSPPCVFIFISHFHFMYLSCYTVFFQWFKKWLLNMYEYLSACMIVPTSMPSAHGTPGKNISYPGTGVIACCQLSRRCWDLNFGSLQKQHLFLSIERSLQHQAHFILSQSFSLNLELSNCWIRLTSWSASSRNPPCLYSQAWAYRWVPHLQMGFTPWF